RVLPIAPRPPTPTLFPYTTLFRSAINHQITFYGSHSALDTWIASGQKADKWHQKHARIERFGAVILRERGKVGVESLLAHIVVRSEEHTSELQSRENLVCRLLLEK